MARGGPLSNLQVMRFLLPVTLLALGAAPLAAQEQSGEPAYPGSFTTPMPLYTKGLGAYRWTITTRSDSAQRFFNQGVQLMYAFATDDAARSFREAERRDPGCAMCWWGEAWAWGPYLNEGMAPDDAPRAAYAVARAVEAARQAGTARERALIEAMAVRYTPRHDADERKRLDSAYARAMKQVWRRFPHDAEVGTMYAEALMLLEPRRGYWDAAKPSVREIHAVLEDVLARNLQHPGACHLYIHATESTDRAEEAAACAEHLGHAIPGASHLNHMPSHTWNRVGRWGDAVRANLAAWHSDEAALRQEGFAIYPSHNLHMLLFAASMDGQGAVAEQAARDYARVQKPAADSVSWGTFYRALVLMRFGRWDEVLALPDPVGRATTRGLWIFAQGYARLRTGDTTGARAALTIVDSLARTTPDSVQFRFHTAHSLLGITGGILRAELQKAAGDPAAAITTLEAAVALEDSLTYDEPEPLPFSARHWLGAHLLEAGRPADAERVYRAELADHPRNGWSLFGLAEALRAQGQDTHGVERDLHEAWARADVALRSSRF